MGCSSLVFGCEQEPRADLGAAGFGSLLADRLNKHFLRAAFVNTSTASPGPLFR